MSDLKTILGKVDKIDADISEIKLSVAENTSDLKHHIKRTDDLQSLVEHMDKRVTPLYEDFIAKRAIEDYKKESQGHRLKLPSTVYYILATLLALGTIIAWLAKVI